ncbi:MAG: hypothetical protein PVI30_18860 [Myxococcales bacterium]|jgi:hypothetical protein
MASDDPELPDLQQADLDEAGLDALVRDLKAMATIHEVRVKHRAVGHAQADPLSLEVAAALLRRGRVHGVQVFYSHRGTRWLDTLMRVQSGYRLVRLSPQMSGWQ